MKDKTTTEARIKLCKQLREIAESKSVTQEEIAQVTGLTRNTINRIFNGRFPPTLDTLIKVCKAIEVKINFSLSSPIKK